jgi:hypothetical protein
MIHGPAVPDYRGIDSHPTVSLKEGVTMADQISIPKKTAWVLGVVFLLAIMALIPCAMDYYPRLFRVKCPVGVWKDPATRICYYLWNDASGNPQKTPLSSCPAGC